MNIPCKACPIGGVEPKLPVGYIKANFLESTGTQYIDTGYVPNNETGLLIDQEKLVAGDVIPMGCRNSIADDTRFYVSRSNSPIDAVGSTCGYGWAKWGIMSRTINGRQIGKLNWRNNRVAELNTASSQSLDTLDFEPTQPIYIYAANIAGQASLVWGGRIYVAQISQGAETVHNYIPAVTPAGVPCMWDTVTKKPFYNSGTGSFITGLTKAQAMRLSSLPPKSTATTLQISLPASILDSSNNVIDTEVKAAMDKAEANGWKFSITSYTS